MKLKQLTLAEHRELITDFFYNIFTIYKPGQFQYSIFQSKATSHLWGRFFFLNYVDEVSKKCLYEAIFIKLW